MPGPLQDLTVVDLTTGTAGPRATGMLADYGADVTWVEPPGGDRFREQLAVPYSVFNRGKRSVELDLRSGEGREALLSLLAGADVFVESGRPGVADELGLGYEALHERFPALVYCSISGFGRTGPYRDVPGYESLVHALVGTMGEQVGVREGPIYEGIPFASVGAAHLADIGVVAALLRRREDGVGRWVETSLYDGALAYLSMLWGDADVPPPPRDPGGRRLVARNFRCADDEIIGVHTGAVGGFGRLMVEVGMDDLLPPSEHGLDMATPLTPEQRRALTDRLPEIFATKPRDAWLERLTEVDVCAVPILTPAEAMAQPQVAHNGMVTTVEDPVLGPVRQVAPGARFQRTPEGVAGPAPTVGAHNGLSVGAPADVAHSGAETDRPLLDGLRVVDFGAYYAGPYGSRLLADLGATVTRVETLAGDPNRGSVIIFQSSHAGMRSIALNLKSDEAKEIARRLIESADVVHHSMRPGAAERLGIGAADVARINPRAVYAYAPGWGSSGPSAQRQSFAPLMSGFVGATAEASGLFNEPVYPAGNEDPGNGLLGAFAMLAGALHAAGSGEGQYVEHPQLNAAMAHVAHIVTTPDGEPLGAGLLDPLQMGFGPLDRLYQTADGWVCLVATSDAEIAALGGVLGVDILGNELFGDHGSRVENSYALEGVIGAAVETRKTAELVADLVAAGVPAAEPVPHNMKAFLSDPQNRASGRVGAGLDPVRGEVRGVGRLVRVSGLEPAPRWLAPGLGEHTAEILTELGYDTVRIAALREQGVIG
jgi:crotonobetainyl-CoA:carnitine CoA-transferase CaiB-like acyl-CoA transferase